MAYLDARRYEELMAANHDTQFHTIANHIKTILKMIQIKLPKTKKNWLLPLTGESLLVFCFLKKSDIMT